MKKATLKPIQQPCKTCDHYNKGKCPVGGEVKPHWTGCIVWQPKTISAKTI